MHMLCDTIYIVDCVCMVFRVPVMSRSFWSETSWQSSDYLRRCSLGQVTYQQNKQGGCSQSNLCAEQLSSCVLFWKELNIGGGLYGRNQSKAKWRLIKVCDELVIGLWFPKTYSGATWCWHLVVLSPRSATGGPFSLHLKIAVLLKINITGASAYKTQ